MISDSERREVARRLREWTWKSAPPECLLNQLAFGDNCPGTDDDPDTIDCHQCEVIAAKRLADLVEPSCDRDALIALADELAEKERSYMAQRPDRMKTRVVSANLLNTSRRIREALGVGHE